MPALGLKLLTLQAVELAAALLQEAEPLALDSGALVNSFAECLRPRHRDKILLRSGGEGQRP